MDEQWSYIQEFPGYAVSNFGQVANLRRDSLIRPVPNAQGIAMAGFFYRGHHTTRSVPLLVANAFLPKTNPAFNAPIQLNGDRMFCHVRNLMWRPRWFAVVYHQQFSKPEFHDPDADLEIEDTGEQFKGWAEPSVVYGLRYIDIIMSYTNHKGTWPTGQRFIRHN